MLFHQYLVQVFGCLCCRVIVLGDHGSAHIFRKPQRYQRADRVEPSCRKVPEARQN
jgi:hypothetical protein